MMTLLYMVMVTLLVSCKCRPQFILKGNAHAEKKELEQSEGIVGIVVSVLLLCREHSKAVLSANKLSFLTSRPLSFRLRVLREFVQQPLPDSQNRRAQQGQFFFLFWGRVLVV